MSFFYSDLNNEKKLGEFLDQIYHNLKLNFERISDIDLQHQGVDIKITHNNVIYFIDEKSQLNYLNNDLPTFAFEINYLKDNSLRKGWLYDENKITDHYFLVTGIYLKSDKIEGGIKSCKITSVNRKKLIILLNQKGITEKYLFEKSQEVRKSNLKNNIPIKELNNFKEGALFFSTQLAEKPINLKLYLNWLIEENVAKLIYS